MKVIILTLTGLLMISAANGQSGVCNSGHLYLAAGAQLTAAANLVNSGTGVIRENGNFKLEKNFTNQGSFSSDSGTLEFIGSTAQAMTGNATFWDLTMNNSSTGLTLNNNIGIAHRLTMNDGDIDLNGSTITLASTASLLNESNDKRIFGNSGTITTTRNINAPTNLNVAGLGVCLTTLADLGSTTISRGHASQVNGSDYSIQRYFDITPANNSSLDARLKLYYYDNELAGLPESNMVTWRSTDGGSSWSVTGADSTDYSYNYVVKSGISSFSRWTINASGNAPLPVELTAFDGECNSGDIRINWTVASENNNKSFTIERSADAENYIPIGNIAGAGNGGFHQYSFTDQEVSAEPVLYYRLVQQDYNGNSKTWGPVSVSTCKPSGDALQFSLYPNPFVSDLYIRLFAKKAESVLVGIYDGKANLLSSDLLECVAGNNVFRLDLSNLAAGEYHFKISMNNEVYSTSVMKN
jgi:hypothetical protein